MRPLIIIMKKLSHFCLNSSHVNWEEATLTVSTHFDHSYALVNIRCYSSLYGSHLFHYYRSKPDFVQHFGPPKKGIAKCAYASG